MKITMYELLGMIKDGKAPKKVKYREMLYHICYEYGDYESDIEEYRFADTKEHYYLFEGIDMLKCLNDEVEILEEKKETKSLTKKDIEALGYACGEIQKCFTNGWTKSLKNKPLEEEKKIPEKLEEPRFNKGRYYIKDINGDNSEISGIERTLRLKINEIIDYLKSKGE